MVVLTLESHGVFTELEPAIQGVSVTMADPVVLDFILLIDAATALWNADHDREPDNEPA